MSNTNIQSLTSMGRRRFLNSLGKIGISAGALSHMTTEALAEVSDDPKDRVPRLEKLRHTNHEAVENGTEPPQREPVYYTIPYDEWVVIETAHDAASRVKQQIASKINSKTNNTSRNPLTNLHFGVTTRTNGHTAEKTVVITYSRLISPNGTEISKPAVSLEWLTDAAPDTATGKVGEDEHEVLRENIPVQVRERDRIQQAYYDGKYRPVPGGCQLQDRSDGGYGTLGTPAWDYDVGDVVLTTAGHCVEAESGHSLDQPYVNHYIGQSDKAKVVNGFDAATIPLGGVDYKYNLADGAADSYNEYIYGTLAWDTIKDHEGDVNYHLYKQGRSTGRQRGHIDTVGDDWTYWITAEGEGGDSGGPNFRDEGSNAYISGIHAWGDINGPNSGATHISKVENWFNLNV